MSLAPAQRMRTDVICRYGFPNPPEVYEGTPEQKDKLRKSYERKIAYMKEINGPIWSESALDFFAPGS
jgi:hypothetical protein